MTVVAAATNPDAHGIMALVDTSRPWYKNRRLVVLNCWILLLYVDLPSSSTYADVFPQFDHFYR